ncbi:hypothetical protein VOLCADRAFT_92848 [Volvox carteri f. nagariensis]|uniref:Uncharacterized protein n=1 Tax=Volvox carteri f. nagariensis TaxID=3068 RepID=D8U0M3_VOLCA|nr:uncharacterized protein VOLCADRAFT_92848 [Volvox carteri f. nagariensis]EFJ46660.1 hypothetical protein VOLCADRAFT_92848 [Volvox carteri f. nagariensis]|eukprot:XP_002952189.1 hypothetical protein VOLCADRAFT_92848 [Volvox carteri f. nagariensis]
MPVVCLSSRLTTVRWQHSILVCASPPIRRCNHICRQQLLYDVRRCQRTTSWSTSSVGAASVQQTSSVDTSLETTYIRDAFDPEVLATAAGVQRLVQCGPTPLGRGLVAPRLLERQVIVSVPLQNTLVITDDPLSGISIFGDRGQELWQQHHGQLPEQLLDFLTSDARWDVRMTAWLLWVASELPDSPVWGPYLASLQPVEEVTCLLNYGPDIAKELQFKELVEEARVQHNWALSVHRNYFDGARGELRHLKLAAKPVDTQWAMSMVRTRTFSEDVNGEGLTLMVPYADMANHSFQYNSTFCMARDNERFELRLLSPLGPGEEASICYGEDKPNFEVMRDYGFVVPGNPNDRIKLPNQDSLPELNGVSLLESVGLKGDWREGNVTYKQSLENVLELAFIRRRNAVLSMNLSDGSRAPKAERAAAAAVRQSYQAALDELPSSIAHDQHFLALYESGGKEELGMSGVEGLDAAVAAAQRWQTLDGFWTRLVLENLESVFDKQQHCARARMCIYIAIVQSNVTRLCAKRTFTLSWRQKMATYQSNKRDFGGPRDTRTLKSLACSLRQTTAADDDDGGRSSCSETIIFSTQLTSILTLIRMHASPLPSSPSTSSCPHIIFMIK